MLFIIMVLKNCEKQSAENCTFSRVLQTRNLRAAAVKEYR